MAFSFGGPTPAGGNVPAELGPELPDVYAEEVGFKGVSGDSNIRLLPNPWPEDALPAPSCSLLAVAPTQGVVVGAGPDSLIVASSDAIRKTISQPQDGDKIKTKPFQPQATIPLPARPTHVTFTSGDNAMVLAMENAPQLSVFETAGLLAGNAQPAISIPTNGATFRFIAPNPAPAEDTHSSLVALVTAGGDLLIANLKDGNLVAGANGQVLKSGVSTVCWSNKGKQLVAGLADGTASQLTPQGEQKAVIPRPSDLEGECHVSSISWLENDIFLMVYTPNAAEDEDGQTSSSSYYIITRVKQAPFRIQKLPELCMPFGFKRAPAYQFIARLRDYKPHIKDVLIVSSTSSTDVGLITRSDEPLASDDAAKATVGLFTTTEVSDDTKRASLPLKDSVDETSVIGLGVDLSSKDIVVAPIQGEDIAESSTPLPNLFLLNNDGILSSWWFIYSESIRQKIPYHGLASANPTALQAQPQTQQPQAEPPKQSAFGQSGFGSSSTLGGSSPFGKPSAAPGFGSPSALGGRQQPSFGNSSFGAPSTIGQGTSQFGKSGFGQTSTLGQSSGFGQTSTLGQSSGFGQTSSFGQTSTPAKTGSALGSTGAAGGGGFGSFASSGGGGFASLGGSKPGESAFGKLSGGSSFAKPSTSLLGQGDGGSSAFGAPDKESSNGTFGLGKSGFVLGSGFKGDGSAATDGPKPDQSSGIFGLGGSLDDMVSTPNKTSPPAESMDDTEDQPTGQQEEKPEPKEPEPKQPEPKQPAPSLFGAPSKIPTTPQSSIPVPQKQTSSLFGQTPPSNPFGQSKPSGLFGQTKPANPFGQTPPSNPFGQPKPTTTSPFSMLKNSSSAKETSPLSPPSEKTATASPPPTEKKSTDVQATPTASMAEPPLPPDPFSKVTYGPGDTSASSNVSKSSVEDAPLPPDFTATPQPKPSWSFGNAPESPEVKKEEEAEDAPLPPDFAPASTSVEEPGPVPDDSDADESGKFSSEEEGESDFGDSGEDVTHDVDHPEEEDHESQSEGEEEEEEDDEDDDHEEEEHTVGQTPKISPESSFEATRHDESSPEKLKKPTSKSALYEKYADSLLPSRRPQTDSPQRSPSPVRNGARKHVPGSALAARKASLGVEERRRNRGPSLETTAQKERAAMKAREKEIKEEEQPLSDDDGDEKLHADLGRPLEPVPTLDPFLPHQDYSGPTSKPGVGGQIERLYRDINSMVDTLGINARSTACFLAYQNSPNWLNESNWTETLTGDHPADVLDEKLRLIGIENLDDVVARLTSALEAQRVHNVEQKLESCREFLSKEILTLRGKCASIRKTVDAHTNEKAVNSAPLSAEQAILQQELRAASTAIQAKLAELESVVAVLRAKIADAPRSDSSQRQHAKRPTVEAVTSTINTMMSMAQSKSSDIDFLEAQLRKMGMDPSAPKVTREEGSPFSTPKKNTDRVPVTPGSRASVDNAGSAYHTPESASRFRSSLNGSARASRLRNVDGVENPVSREESAQWKAKMQRRKYIVGSLKQVIGEKQVKVRGVDDL